MSFGQFRRWGQQRKLDQATDVKADPAPQKVSGLAFWRHRLGWQLWLWQRGLAPLLMLALVLLALLFACWGWQARQQSQTLAQQFSQAQARQQNRSQPQPTLSHDAQRYQHFRQTLLSAEALNAQLSQMFQQAKKIGLTLGQGSYRWVEEPSGEFQRYQIEWPLKAPYPALRQFSTQLLLTQPALAIEEIRFKREDIKDPQTETLLKLTLFIQPDVPQHFIPTDADLSRNPLMQPQGAATSSRKISPELPAKP